MINLSLYAEKSELADTAVTGMSAYAMPAMAAQVCITPWCGCIGLCYGVHMEHRCFKTSHGEPN
jgi:hypothetical protein